MSVSASISDAGRFTPAAGGAGGQTAAATAASRDGHLILIMKEGESFFLSGRW